MSSILEHICTNTYTYTELHRRLGLLQECLEEVLYHERTEGESLAATAVAYAFVVGDPSDAAALSQWDHEVWKSFSANNLVDQIALLKTSSESLPLLTLYVPVELNTDETALLGKWAKEQVSKNILLELIVDPKVVGGCAFVINDTYHEFSLRQAMENHRGLVTQLLTSYV